MTAIATGQVSIPTGSSAQIVAFRSGRTQLRLYGLGVINGNRVLIGHDNTTSITSGYFESGSLVLSTDGAVWGIADGTTAMTVSYLEAY